MSVRFTKIRIAGFKSFAEPVSLDILPGLTGIVGPNGCGKSNVAEALRWAMGETSARSLRGGEMDDVIFAGTTARASRNLAEVALTLEAGEGLLPAPFEAEAELQVTRRIERGAGSVFRANGRELRARDVQTLYADLASGARSSGMVSQGRVSDLVRARPEDRRSVLEEAAGITGLHARRSEAELKLRAAEQNLARAEDLRAQLDGARQGLRGQARQAARYRAISGLVRAAEAEHLGVLHGQAAAALEVAKAAEALAGDALHASAAAEREAAEALAGAEAWVFGPRNEEAAARTILERRRLEDERLGEEAARAAREADDAASRLRDLASDLAHCNESCADAQATVDRLGAEREQQAARLASLPVAAAQAAEAALQARAAMSAAQGVSDEASRLALSQATAWQQASEAQRRGSEQLVALEASHAGLAGEHVAAMAGRVGAGVLAAAGAALSGAEAALDDARAALGQAEIDRSKAAALSLAQRAQAERAADASGAAERRVRDAAGRASRQQVVCAAARATLAKCEAARIPLDQTAASASLADSALAALATAEDEVSWAEQTAAEAQAEAAAAKIALDDRRAVLARAQEARSAAQARIEELGGELAAAEAALAAAEQAATPEDVLTALQVACMAAEQICAACASDRQGADDARETASLAAAQARSVLAASEARYTQLSAERRGLQAALGSPGEDDGALAALQVPDGLHAALGAALGELGRASLDASDPLFWRTLPALPPVALPEGSVALSSLIDTPAALARALCHVALLADGADGLAVQAALAPGVVAVNRAGACWRWDGHVRCENAPNWAAERLSLRSELAEAGRRLGQAADAADTARARLASAEADQVAAEAAAQAALSASRSADIALRDAAQAFDAGKTASAQAVLRVALLQPAVQSLRDAYRTAEAARERLHAEDGSPDKLHLEQAHLAAATAACSAADALNLARNARADARLAEQRAREAARRLGATSEAAEAEASAAAAALARAEAELTALNAAEQEARAARLSLPDLAQLGAAARAAEAREAAAQAEEAAIRTRREAAEAALDLARRDQSRLQTDYQQAEWQIASLADQLRRSQAALDAAQDAMAQAASVAAALPDPRVSEDASMAASLASEQAREYARMAEIKAAALQAGLGHAKRALDGSCAEMEAWTRRLGEADARRASLAERHETARKKWSGLAAYPAEAAQRAASSGAALAEAEQRHAAAAAALADAEQRVRDRSAALREAAQHAGASRDRQIRAEASCLAAANGFEAVLARAAERLDEAAIPNAPDLSAMAEDRARRKLERLSREREEMGPVNLLAERELEALDGRIGALEQQRADVEATIAKLRGAIGLLNREGRERLKAVFDQVDQHFRALFTRMMGGGRAHLALSGSDDPLAAGLEIYAEPPGKKLSALSLLSGGEQALTALSLIFAVFRCTPSPLCVLDEVDAPLDDANVERFCTLLDDVVRDTGTRFLVVTHHQLTMSRMDRLFGVTMQERGVSSLLSVDFQRAATMAEPLRQAAE